MKLNKYQIVSIIVIVISVILCAANVTFGSILLIGGIIALVVIGKKSKKLKDEQTIQAHQPTQAAQPVQDAPTTQPHRVMREIKSMAEDMRDEDGLYYELRYIYDKVEYESTVELPIGDYFRVRINNGIAAIIDSDDVIKGHIKGDKHIQMISDFSRRKEPVLVRICDKGFLLIGFYKRALTRMELESHAHISCTLTHNSDDDSQTYILASNIGDREPIEVDYNDDCEIFYNVGGLGRLSSSATSFIDNNGGDTKQFVAFVDEITENDNGKYKVKVTVYKK